MSNLKDKVLESESFYNTKFLNFDYQLADYNFQTLKRYFKGDLALELGPASGFMTKQLVKEFKQLHIVEGSERLLQQIPDFDNMVKHHSFFEDFNTDLKFDTIIMSHVLEHISNPVEVLQKIKNWLSDDGVLLVSVPNAKSIHRLVAVEMNLLATPYELNQRDHELGHYRVYDMDLLKTDILNAGFKIKENGGVFFKPVSNGQIDENWSTEMKEGFYKIGKYFPEYCAEIYVVATL